MQFLILALAATATAIPAAILKQQRSPLDVCPALDTPLCCQADVDGVLALTCEAPETTTSVSAFEASCAKTGLTAKCCTLPLAGDALLCSDP